MERRISKQELMKLYGVDRSTIENWKENCGLPLIEINSHSKFVRSDELEEWENNQTMKRDTQKKQLEETTSLKTLIKQIEK